MAIAYDVMSNEYVDMFEEGIIDPCQGDPFGRRERRLHRGDDPVHRSADHRYS